MAKAKKNQKQYEGMFLFGSSFAAELEKAQGMVKKMVEAHSGEIIVMKKWDERKLAYELGGQKRGVYILCYFTAPGTAIAQIERDVNLSEDVLRVLITDATHMNKDEMDKVEPQPIIREERVERSWDRPMGAGGYDSRPPRPRRDEAGMPEAAMKD